MATHSVTRALTELKHLKISQARANSDIVIGLSKGLTNPEVLGHIGQPMAEATKVFKSAFDKRSAEFDRMLLLKKAIVLSNAQTMVTIAGRTMNVASAIEEKALLPFRKSRLTTYRLQYAGVQQQAESKNASLEAAVDEAVSRIYTNAKKADITPEQRKVVADPILQAGTIKIVDPNGLAAWLQKESDDIAAFEAEVDFVLSESNSTTMIDDILGLPEVTGVVRAVEPEGSAT